MVNTDARILDDAKRKCWEHLKETYKEFDHFPIYEYHPDYEIKKDLGWDYTYPSPFLHAHVMYALLNTGIYKNDSLIQSGLSFLLNFKEPGDLWRFWRVEDSEHPVYCGVDDTAISSLVLEKLGIAPQNKKILYSLINKDGSILTWVTANTKLLKINPFVYLYYRFKDRPIAGTIKKGFLADDDAEPVITANALAYLGQTNKTQSVINYLIKCWEHDTADHYVFYEKKLMFAFHLARAYKEGVTKLEVLIDSIGKYIEGELNNFVFAELLMAYLTLAYFNAPSHLVKMIDQKIIEQLPDGNKYLEPYPYITSKNRVYFGGGPGLTAAWFIEYCCYRATKD